MEWPSEIQLEAHNLHVGDEATITLDMHALNSTSSLKTVWYVLT